MSDYENNNNNNNDGESNFILVEENTKAEFQEKKKTDKNKKYFFRGSVLSYIALALVTSFLGGFAAIYVAPSLYGKILPYPDNKQYIAQAININTNDSISTVSAVAKKAMNSVVGITTVETRQAWPFYGTQDVGGVGSGVIIDSNGYILTNSHVIADGNAKELMVLLENGDQIDGDVVWNDAIIDLAVVKVDKINLPVADLGDSDKLEVGEIAIAIGNPFGLEFQRTVTSGVISGLNRTVTVDGGIISDLIQTDASINFGNSGGPLLNGNGEVIGINTVKVNPGEGLGFAIPINQVKLIVDEILETGTYKAAYIGIKGVDVKEYESRLGVDLSADNGVVVIEVIADSPAIKADIQTGDIITKMDDIEISGMDQLKQQLYNYKVGDKMVISIIRNSKEMNLNLEF